MSKPLLVTFVGVPGSGKTTFARQLRDRLGGVTINSDSIRLSMWGSREAIKQTHSIAEERKFANKLTFGALDYAAGQVIAAGYNVIYDCNANKITERESMRQIAQSRGGSGVTVYVRTPRDVAIKRAIERQETHDQPKMLVERAEDVIDRFLAEIEEPLDSEPFIEISGELPFDKQYQSFEAQLAAIKQ